MSKTSFSIVMAGRLEADDPSQVRQTRNCLRAWRKIFGEGKVQGEIVLVVWNFVGDFTQLAAGLTAGQESNPSVRLRLIEVPQDVHRQLPHGNLLEDYRHVALNVGLRRAEGDFLLVTRPDVVPSKELVAFLSKGDFGPDKVYTCSCFDAELADPSADFDALPADARLLRFHGGRETVNNDKASADFGQWRVPSDIWLDSLLGFLRLSFAFHGESGFIYKRVYEVMVQPGGVPWKARFKLAIRLLMVPWLNMLLLARDSLKLYRERRTAQAFFAPVQVQNVYDFLLTGRTSWHGWRGFPEFPGDGQNIGVLLLLTQYLRNSAGIANLAPPNAVFRLGAGAGQELLPPVQVPSPGMLEIAGMAQAFADDKSRNAFNGEQWGLGGVAFREILSAF